MCQDILFCWHIEPLSGPTLSGSFISLAPAAAAHEHDLRDNRITPVFLLLKVWFLSLYFFFQPRPSTKHYIHMLAMPDKNHPIFRLHPVPLFVMYGAPAANQTTTNSNTRGRSGIGSTGSCDLMKFSKSYGKLLFISRGDFMVQWRGLKVFWAGSDPGLHSSTLYLAHMKYLR